MRLKIAFEFANAICAAVLELRAVLCEDDHSHTFVCGVRKKPTKFRIGPNHTFSESHFQGFFPRAVYEWTGGKKK